MNCGRVWRKYRNLGRDCPHHLFYCNDSTTPTCCQCMMHIRVAVELACFHVGNDEKTRYT